MIIQNSIRASFCYLSSIWGALPGLFLFLALWEFGSSVYGSFILPAPLETFTALAQMIEQGRALSPMLVTATRALSGFVFAVSLGSLLGLLAGLSVTFSKLLRPVVTVLLGVPPIAWIVLALIWFGMGGATPIFTVLVTTFPIAFIAAVEGMRTVDQRLLDMANSFNASFSLKIKDLYFPHLLSYLFPAWVTALGMAWKVTVMAELLATSDGIGASLAIARVNLETDEAMGWVVAVVLLLLAVEYLILEPLKRKLEPWRKSVKSNHIA
ncbi:MAG: ABC transporter permease subunit [Oceanospirillaceae bacterium]|nr:ABC transporter permease subunit [Oceanospirillaceae bacterium]